MNFISEELENYCEEYSVSDDIILKRLTDSTMKNEELPHMLCGPLVGGLLQLLIEKKLCVFRKFLFAFLSTFLCGLKFIRFEWLNSNSLISPSSEAKGDLLDR